MTYKIRIRHKIPNKVFPLTLRYDDSSLNLPVINVNLSDTFQVVELTGWDAIRGFIDPNKVKIDGSINEGNKVYVVGNLNIASVVETIEQNVEITGTVKKEEIEVNINGSIRKEEIEVNIEGTVKKEDVEVNIEGTVKKEVNVEIEGVVKYIEIYTYKVYCLNSVKNYNIKWTTDEEGTQVIAENTNQLSTSEESVYAHFSKDGYIPNYLYLTKDNDNNKNVGFYLYKEQYTFVVTVLPEVASGVATFEWYSDEDLTHHINNASGNSLTTILDTVWVKVNANGYKDVPVTIMFQGLFSENETIELEPEETPENLVVTALPMTEWTRNYPGLLQTSAETGDFVLALSNDQNRNVNYNVSIENTATLDSTQKYSCTSKQIDVGEYSIFIIHKRGYPPLNKTTGTFTISTDYSDNVTFNITSGQDTEHKSFVRNQVPYSYGLVQIVPYSAQNTNFSMSLLGMADGAAEISGNTVKYYTGGSDVKETPSIEKTYSCHKDYAYYIQNQNCPNVSFDSNDMITNINLTVKRLYSTLTFDITPNNLDRIRFGVLRLAQTSNDDSYEDCLVLNSILQESENHRFVMDKTQNYTTIYAGNTNILEVIDISSDNNGTRYEIPLSQTKKEFNIWFWSDVADKITVTTFDGVELTGVKSSNDIGGYFVRYTFNSTRTRQNSYYNDGFYITINNLN